MMGYHCLVVVQLKSWDLKGDHIVDLLRQVVLHLVLDKMVLMVVRQDMKVLMVMVHLDRLDLMVVRLDMKVLLMMVR